MTLEQLRIFAAVAKRLHMTEAAKDLHITQSAASAAVAALEARYGVLLFNRVGRGLELSEAGRIFLSDARAVLSRAEAAQQSLDELAGLKRGTIRLAASQTIANYWLPPRMMAFAAAHPALALHLSPGNTRTVAQAVLEGSADIGFAEGEAASPLLSKQRVGGDRLSLYAALDNPLASGTGVSARDLLAAGWVMREPGSGTRSELEGALSAMGIDPGGLKIALVLPSNEAVLAAIARGGSIAAISDLAAAPHLAAGTLRRVAFDLKARDFDLLAHKDRPASRAVSAFLRQLG